MFILAFSFLIALDDLNALYAPYSWTTEHREPLSEETLEGVFGSAQKKKKLSEFEQTSRAKLERQGSCKKTDTTSSQDWLILAQIQVDLYNLNKGQSYLNLARKSAQAAVECNVANQPARRLMRDLKGN